MLYFSSCARRMVTTKSSSESCRPPIARQSIGRPSWAGRVHFGGWPGKRLELPQQGTITFIRRLLGELSHALGHARLTREIIDPLGNELPFPIGAGIRQNPHENAGHQQGVQQRVTFV